MHHLRAFSACHNKLRHIPTDLGCSKTIETLHLSNNHLMELPVSITRLSRMQSLWLDFNNISALPMNFHLLTRLTDLKMEGNTNLVLPVIETISQGASAVLEWSKRRLSQSDHVRRQNVALTIQDLLKQVGRHRIGGRNGEPHESIYAANVDDEDG